VKASPDVQIPILLIHLLGLVLAVGSVLIVDLRLLQILRRRVVAPSDICLIENLKPYVTAGLLFLWISGVFLVMHNIMGSPAFIHNPKLHAKILIVVVLTVNGLLVERCALKLIRIAKRSTIFEL
jgi:uncharacterized membrane protein